MKFPCIARESGTLFVICRVPATPDPSGMSVVLDRGEFKRIMVSIHVQRTYMYFIMIYLFGAECTLIKISCRYTVHTCTYM